MGRKLLLRRIFPRVGIALVVFSGAGAGIEARLLGRALLFDWQRKCQNEASTHAGSIE